MGLAIVGGGDRIRAEAILLKKIGKPEPDRIQLAVNCSIKIAMLNKTFEAGLIKEERHQELKQNILQEYNLSHIGI